MTTEMFLQKVKERQILNNYDYSKVVITDMRGRITLICPTHGEFQVYADKHLYRKDGCKKCSYENSKTRHTLEEFINKSNIVHGNKYDYSKAIYKSGNNLITIICPKHGEFLQKAGSHMKGYGCNRCAAEYRAKLNTLPFKRWVEISSLIHNNYYDYTKSEKDYKNTSSKIVITCPSHGDFLQSANKHADGFGCPECRKHKLHNIFALSTEEFIKNAKLIHGETYSYDKVVYKTNKTPVIVTCKKHGDFSVKPNMHISNKTGCPICSASKGEIKISEICKKHNIKYIHQYKFDGYNYKYDFYLPDLNIMVEYHGEQHYRPVDAFGGEEGYKIRISDDRIKVDLCVINQIPLIIIPYTEYKNLESFLFKKISYIYRYYYNGKFYYNFLYLCKSLGFSPDTKPSDIRQYLTTNYFKCDNKKQ